MKQIVTLAFLFLTITAWSQKLPKIKGSGIVEVMDVQLTEPFNAIDLDGDMEVELIQGKENGYSIETDDNLIEVVEFAVADSTLYVSLNSRITKKKKFLITIKASDVAQIDLKNEARLESDKTLTGDRLNITAGNSTKYELDVAHKTAVTIEMYSNAEGVLKSKSKESSIRLDDRASLKLYGVVDSLTLDATDNTRLALDGIIQTARLTLKESAKISGKEASLAQADINLSDTSDAVINTKETITIYAQDTSELQLYGDPEITITGLKNKAKILKKE